MGPARGGIVNGRALFREAAALPPNRALRLRGQYFRIPRRLLVALTTKAGDQ